MLLSVAWQGYRQPYEKSKNVVAYSIKQMVIIDVRILYLHTAKILSLWKLKTVTLLWAAQPLLHHYL